jgi:acetyl esterase/lipase
MRYGFIGLSVLLVFGLASVACAQQAPKGKLPAGVKVERDLEYVKDGHERNRLDLYLPEKADARLPLVVWIHGGGWTQGDKAPCPLAWLVPKGYVVASINYRFLKHGDPPAQIEDCKAAIRWLRANATKYNFDPDRVGVAGASAGGYLVALLGTSGGVKELEGNGGNMDQSSRVQCVVDLFGPTRIKNGDAKRDNVLTYIGKDTPPFLILHGDADKLVPLAASERLNEALKKAGVEVNLVVMKGAGHGGNEFRTDEVMRMYVEFFDRHLKKGKPAKQ